MAKSKKTEIDIDSNVRKKIESKLKTHYPQAKDINIVDEIVVKGRENGIMYEVDFNESDDDNWILIFFSDKYSQLFDTSSSATNFVINNARPAPLREMFIKILTDRSSISGIIALLLVMTIVALTILQAYRQEAVVDGKNYLVLKDFWTPTISTIIGYYFGSSGRKNK